MSETDNYGRLTISERYTAPRKGWAYMPLGRIDPDLIFATKYFASEWAMLDTDDAPVIRPVIIRGTEITLAD